MNLLVANFIPKWLRGGVVTFDLYNFWFLECARLGGFWEHGGTNYLIQFSVADGGNMNWRSNLLDPAMGHSSNPAFDFKCYLYAFLHNSFMDCNVLAFNALLQFCSVHFLDLLVNFKDFLMCFWFFNFHLLSVFYIYFWGFLIMVFRYGCFWQGR